MTKRKIQRVYAELLRELTERDFLDAAGLQKENVQELLKRELWEEKITALLKEKRRYSCAELYALCSEAMRQVASEPEEGWMVFSYRYACRLLFPEKAEAERDRKYRAGALFYLAVLRFFFDLEREAVPFDPMRDFCFLEPEEAEQFETAEEYRRFRQRWRREYIYEMMRLNAEVTRFNTLEHIAGVHYVAMTIARGLLTAGAPIDLALVSGAAAGHDIGKFGCRPNEKVPYMHYYYTDLWYLSRNMRYIGHIAANHSTWDLEPENLSVESLALIYSDFRVKVSRGADGREMTRISSLAEAFDVILNKLTDVDEKKLRRYRFVYAKLQDFEKYMQAHGVDIALNGRPASPERVPAPVLQSPKQLVDSLVFMAVEHNMDVMHCMTAERQFGNLLEAARSEKSWKNVRAYLNILREYFTYTNDTQKEQTLSFLYELFMNRDGEIRVQAAELMGQMIAQFNAGYRKQRPTGRRDPVQEKVLQLWKHYLQLVIRPDYRLIELQQRRIRSQLKNILLVLSEYAEQTDLAMFLEALMEWYADPEGKKPGECFVLLNSVEVMPFSRMGEGDILKLTEFAVRNSRSGDREQCTSAWRAMKQIAQFLRGAVFPDALRGARRAIEVRAEEADVSESAILSFLKYRILDCLDRNTAAERARLYGNDIVTDIFLDNLKTDTPWIVKTVNIKLLADLAEHTGYGHELHIAAHFSNMIKVGQYMLVRNTAGEQLIRLAPRLRVDQRNEIAVELLRGLETGDSDYSRSIPRWLGRFALWLPPTQLEELIGSLKELIASPSDHVVSVVLDTVGTMLEHIAEYGRRFPEPESGFDLRRKRLLGVLLTGMASYREKLRQEALLVLGQRIFGSDVLGLREKNRLFGESCRKILFQLTERRENKLTHFYRAASLSNLYRFITEYRLTEGAFSVSQREKVAFFPGTFDPFTLSHKGIARKIRDLGFEVYLSVDEFSWSKKAQPHLIRREIVNMSVADEFHINLFPCQMPVNPGNPDDLERLKQIFAGRELYLVVGSDVIAHASFYRNPGEKTKVLREMNHIAFRRVGDTGADSRYNREMMKRITGKLLELELPEELGEISSSRIRENIDMNRDISDLIDPVVQEYIYSSGLYLREPEYKPIIQARAISYEEVATPYPALLEEIGASLLYEEENREELMEAIRRSGDRLLLLRNHTDGGRLVGAARVRYLVPDQLFSVLKQVELTDMVRQHSSGELLLISGIYVERDPVIYDAEQLLLAEALVRSFMFHCDYALFYPEDGYCPNRVISAVLRQGFVKPPEARRELPLYAVDMHAPLLLLSNMETTLKEPFSSNRRVLKAIRRAQQDLQHAMTKLYPGQLVLAISATVLYHRLVDKITALNAVPREVQTPRRLGELMCVPFGKILRGTVVPNTVTKTLHTDKVYGEDLLSASVEAFPNYTPLPTQVKVLKSFDRPVILVDDVMNRSGIRFSTLEPMLRREQVEIRRVLLGVISGYGRDMLATMDIEADSVYYVPNMRYWFVESSLYPFIGGDTVRRDSVKTAGLAPSINLIRPYTSPPLSGASEEALFQFSACCIRNARDVLLVLEQEYRALFSRNLTLSRLPEAVILPLCPDKGSCISYDPNLAASVYLENDLQMLYRSKADTGHTKNRCAEGEKG